MKRPTSITVISWIYIVLSVLSLLASLASLGNSNPSMQAAMQQAFDSIYRVPRSVLYVQGFISLVIALVCAIGFLKGINWSRWLFVILSVLGIVLSLVEARHIIFGSIIFGLIILAIVSYFLFCKTGNAWFTRNAANAGA